MIPDGAIAVQAAMMAMVTLVGGCMKATSQQGSTQIGDLIEHIETVAKWRYSPERRERTEWLTRAVAWDIVGAVVMTTAAPDIDGDIDIDKVLQSGLIELAAGPGDYVESLVSSWRGTLGPGTCRSGAASDDDVRWVRDRLAMPTPPHVGPVVRRALANYAERAKGTHSFVRIDCGNATYLVVGVLGDQLVPIPRT